MLKVQAISEYDDPLQVSVKKVKFQQYDQVNPLDYWYKKYQNNHLRFDIGDHTLLKEITSRIKRYNKHLYGGHTNPFNKYLLSCYPNVVFSICKKEKLLKLLGWFFVQCFKRHYFEEEPV